jgi:hypothetical protein
VEVQSPEEVMSTADELLRASASPALGELLGRLLENQRELRSALDQLRQQPGPRMLVDILFPPFKTTIDDPAYAEKRTIVGPWYD